MQTYETTFIARPTLTEEEERSTVESMAAIITGGGGTLVYTDRMGRRRLAYPIQKHNDGVYTRFLYDAVPDVPKELERRLRLSDHVLRALTVRLEPGWAVAAKEQAKEDEARLEAERIERERQEREAAAAAVTDTSEPAPEGAAEAPPQPKSAASETTSAGEGPEPPVAEA